MKKERKKPPVQIKTIHTFVGNKYGDRIVTSEERNKILYPLHKFKHKGKGLPEKVRKESECQFYTFSFDIRMTHGEEDGTLELGYALKNSDTYTIKPFEGLSGKKSCNAKGDFERNLHRMIKDTCFILAEVCVKNHTEDFEKKRELLEQVIEHLSLQYKKLLGLGHHKIIEQFENDDGMKVEKSVFIDYGARPQTKEEKEKEKKEFLDEVYSAFRKFKQNHVADPKQKDLMPYMFKMHTDKEKKISEMFKKHNLDFKMLWLIFNATENYDDFINNAIRTNRVTSK